MANQHALASFPEPALGLIPEALGGESSYEAPRPIPVTAWVPFETGYRRVDAQAIAWTRRAVLLAWTPKAGKEHRIWVWANAVRRRERLIQGPPATMRPNLIAPRRRP
jgi:hypothetical protein